MTDPWLKTKTLTRYLNSFSRIKLPMNPVAPVKNTVMPL